MRSLAHVTVSRRHSEIRPTHDDFEFADTGSLNATYLNKEAVDSVPVTDGDEIQTGVFRVYSPGDTVTLLLDNGRSAFVVLGSLAVPSTR